MRPVRNADNLTTFLLRCLETGNLNFLEASGPLQDCNGTDLLLPFISSLYWTGSSVGIAIDYGLDYPGIEFR